MRGQFSLYPLHWINYCRLSNCKRLSHAPLTSPRGLRGPTKAAILSRKELILTLQVFGVSLFHIVGYVTWEYVPIPWHLPIGVYLGHFVWMLWNSINPMFYVLINPRIRNLVLGSLGIQTKVSGRTLFVTSHVSTVRSSKMLQI
uniref:Uncharacterized protein n=1 Tax=Caenorhabditis japonica TaxID=281687 RepID=A0A8R1I7P4_CAEJA